jgi:hypothetical protein
MNSRIKFRVWRNGDGREYDAVGQTASASLALENVGDAGLSAQDYARLAHQYPFGMFDLRTRCGLEIARRSENHLGGIHCRYVLTTPIEIVLIEADDDEKLDQITAPPDGVEQ